MGLWQPLKGAVRSIIPESVYYKACKAYDRAYRVSLFFTYQGLALKCPFCGFRFRRFVADDGRESPLFKQEHVIGGGPFDNAECPYCGSFERERHVYLYLREMTDVFTRPVRLLHFAPERRLQRVLAIHPSVDYVSADLCSPLADLHIDITDTRLPADSFDVIVCNHVLEHIPDDRKAMRELFRILRPGGWALLQVPIAASRETTLEDATVSEPADRLRLYGQMDHVRIYGKDYSKRLQEAGFDVRLHSIREKLGDNGVRRFGIIPDEDLYVAGKRAVSS
jgi:SAM-dependent methyltransferase